MIKNLILFIKYYGKNRKLGIISFAILSILAGLLDFVGIGLIYPFLMMIVKPEIYTNRLFYTQFANLTNINDTGLNTLIIGILIVSMFISKNLLMIFCNYRQNKFVINWKNDINNMIMNYYIQTNYGNTFKNNSSEKIYNMTVLTSQSLETFVSRSFIFFTNIFITLLILTVLYIKFQLIAIFITLFAISGMYFMNKFFKQKTEKLAPQMLEYSLKNNNQVIENVKNLKEIRIFSAENYFLNKFKKIQKENNDVIFKNTFYAGIPPYLVEIILVCALIILAIVITCKNIGNSSEIIASYGLITAVIFRIAPSLNRIQIALNHMNSSKEMIKKMNKEYEINRFDEIKKPEIASNIEFKEKLQFENISFEYKKDEPILKNISFEIKKGEFVGIIGLSGAGKTTLADILTGLLQVNNGLIKVDDTAITEENLYGLRRLIGYVPQEINILEDTYKHNVAWGKEYYEIEEDRVIESLKEARLYEFVESIGGINSVIKGLSQGQKQRLLIARALYKNPEIIIFDEATSSLDVSTEHEITQMLTSLKTKKTIITIAHRLVTLKECDKIIYLKDGAIIDIGTFSYLTEKYKDFEKLINLSKF